LRPRRFNPVAMREKIRDVQHGVEKQPLVAVCGRFAKCSFVAEPDGDLGKVRGQSRGLAAELKANAISLAECGAL
jgi:hypothetical protein